MNDVATPAPTQGSKAAAVKREPVSLAPLPATRQAGVCMHLTSLPGPYGIGEIGKQAFKFIDTLAETGLKVWQFLPLGPTAYGDSPYQSLSTLAGNELLIDMANLTELGILKSSELQELEKLPADRVDYGELIPLKNRLLAQAAQRFEACANAELKQACDAFVEKHEECWLHDYALYRTLKHRHGDRAWTQWDDPFRRRDPGALAHVEKVSADQIAEIKIIQFLFYRQWQQLRAYASGKGVSLFGDMPIYIAHDSADAWAHPELLRMDVDGRPEKVAGVPPDYFSEDGQMWGNPLYDWDYHAAQGYAWWIERLRHTQTLVDLVRIDHFRGFEAYWAIPASARSARSGSWEMGPGDAIFEAMRMALGKLPIIAEDLGEITAAVDELRDRQHIPGMKVLQFLAGETGFDLSEIGQRCVCYTGTHDNDTVLGWFHGGPGDVRDAEQIRSSQAAVMGHTKGHAENIHHDLVRLAFSSEARIAIAMMQDYLGLGSEARMNTPGTSRNNWRWRLTSEHLTADAVEQIRKLVTLSGRA
jgi:4-alpha-glucanotransferase